MISRLIEIRHADLCARVYPERGFQLYGFERDAAGEGTLPLIYVPSLDREPDQRRYGNPVLFPCCGISKSRHGENTWEWKGRAYPMPPHGFARNHYWRVLEIQKHRVSAELTPTQGSQMCFPFNFRLQLSYTLDDRGLVLDAAVENPGQEAFPYALGFHPYLLAHGGRGKCSLVLPPATLNQSRDGWQTYESAPVEERLVRDEDISGSIMLSHCPSRKLELASLETSCRVGVSVAASEQSFPWWVVWSAATDAPYVCIEPWTDATNALNRPGARTCPPGGVHCYQMVLSVQEDQPKPRR